MRESKRKKLAAKGWKIGGAQEFLGLSEAEEALIELRLKLADGLKSRRHARGVTQTQLAESLRSSQSRVAKMEAADETVSTDLLLRSLFRLGASRRDVARLLNQKSRTRAATLAMSRGAHASIPAPSAPSRVRPLLR